MTPKSSNCAAFLGQQERGEVDAGCDHRPMKRLGSRERPAKKNMTGPLHSILYRLSRRYRAKLIRRRLRDAV